MQKQKRLGTIATLMVLSFLMLAGFTIRWLYVQYGEENKQLKSKLNTVFEKRLQYYFDKAFGEEYLSKPKLIDSANLYGVAHSFIVLPNDGKKEMPDFVKKKFDSLHRQPMIIAKKMKLKEAPKMSGIYISDSTVITKDIHQANPGTQTHSNIHISISNNTDQGKQALTTSHNSSLTTTSNSIDTSQIKTAIMNMITSFGKSAFSLDIDTLSFRKDMDSVMRSTYSGVHYTYQEPAVNELLIAKPKNSYEHLYFSISNYRWYLIGKMAAQIGFCIVLLLLCSLAFLISFFTIRQQMRLSEQKNDFISNMSHELKTPVTTAQLALEAFNHFDIIDNPKKTKDYLQIAAWEMKRLEMLVANVLNNARLEEGRILFHKEDILLNSLLAQLVQQFHPLCIEQNKELAFEDNHEAPHFFGDKLHLQGVFYNVIDNAIKYGKQKINVLLSSDAQFIFVQVSDDGAGIASQYQDKIFDKFFRIPSGNEHLVKGYGLGLHYAKYVVLQHGGTIRAEANPLGGATILISLPKALRQ